MTTAERKTLLTVEEFVRTYAERDCRTELAKGEVIEMAAPGWLHSTGAVRLSSVLLSHVDKHDLGYVMVEMAFLLSRNPDTVRLPDVAFVRKERVTPGSTPGAFFEGAPDLAVEVVSPGDTATELEAKLREYLEAGSKEVWLVYPELRGLRVCRPVGVAQWHSESDTVDGGDLLPGLSLRVRQIFGPEG